MVAFTSPDNLPYEHPILDQPGVTLDGGEFGTERILAEAVQAALDARDVTIADLEARLTQAERGWTPIASGDATGLPSFTVDLTVGGEFPAGTFEIVRMRLIGDLDAIGHVGVRLNADSSTIYRRHYRATESDGTLVNTQTFTGSAWLVGRWGESAGNSVMFEMFGTDTSSLVSYQTRAFQQVNSAEGIDTVGGGRLEANRLPNSMTVFATNGATAFGNAPTRYWVEGYRA